MLRVQTLSYRTAVNATGTPRPAFGAAPSLPRDGAAISAAATPGDPFAGAGSYQAAGNAAVARLGKDREALAQARAERESLDKETAEAVAQATRRRDAEKAAARGPLDSALSRLASVRAQLQGAVDRAKAELDAASQALAALTGPEIANKQAELASLQASLPGLVSKRDADQAALPEAQIKAKYARQYAPPEEEWNRAQADLADARKSLADSDRWVSDLSRQIASDRSFLSMWSYLSDFDIRYPDRYDERRAIGGFYAADPGAYSGTGGSSWYRTVPRDAWGSRPVPPSVRDGSSPAPPPVDSGYGSDRPTPPPVGSGSSGDRPAPPPVGSGSGSRPVPPGVDPEPDWSRANDFVREAWWRLEASERQLAQAQLAHDYAYARVREIQRQVDRMAGPRDEAIRAEAAARDLAGKVQSGTAQIASANARIASLQAEIPELQKLRTDTAIAAAQTRLGRASDQLARESQAYDSGTRPYVAAADAAQATYDARMAPFEKALAEAQASRTATLQPTDARIAEAESAVGADQGEIARLRDGVSLWKRFVWWLPRFLGGASFSTSGFWKSLGVG